MSEQDDLQATTFLNREGNRVDILSAIDEYSSLMKSPVAGCKTCRTTRDYFSSKNVVSCTGDVGCVASGEAHRKRALIFYTLLQSSKAEIQRLRFALTKK